VILVVVSLCLGGAWVVQQRAVRPVVPAAERT
jgi:hypothetical protein